MCKNSKERRESQSPSRCSLTAGAFVFISAIFSVTMAFLVIWQVSQTTNDVCAVHVTLSVPSDSLAMDNILQENESQMQAIINVLDKQSREITDKYELLLKSQETESDFFRLVSCIAAFVVALLGFLGYKTVRDIEAKAQSMAKDQASETARKYVSDYLKKEVEAQMKDLIGDSTVAKLVEEQLINRIMPKLKPLEDRIGKLESYSQSQSESTLQFDDGSVDAFAYNAKEIADLNTQAGGEGYE